MPAKRPNPKSHKLNTEPFDPSNACYQYFKKRPETHTPLRRPDRGFHRGSLGAPTSLWNKHVHSEMAWGALELVVWVLIQVGVGSWALPACRMTGCGIFSIGLPGRSSLQLKPHSLDRVIGGWCRISSMLHPTSQIPTSGLFMVNLQEFESGLRTIAAGIPFTLLLGILSFQLVGFYCGPHKGQGDYTLLCHRL